MKTIIPLATLFALFCQSNFAFGQSSARFSIARSVVAGGGATFSTSSRFQLGSTVAQPVSSVPNGHRFSIQSGFWIWPAPIIFAPTKAGGFGSFTFFFQTEAGKTYTVSYSDSLASPKWQTLTIVGGDGTVKSATDSASGPSQRYYRLIEQ